MRIGNYWGWGYPGGGATLEGESEDWELLGVGLPWKVRVRVGNYWGWGYPGR